MRPLIEPIYLHYPEERIIYYSRTKAFICILILSALGCFSCFVWKMKDGRIFSLLIFIIICYHLYGIIKLLKKINQPQFKINSKGIQFRNEDFISWHNIQNERLITEGTRKNAINYFVYYIVDQDKVLKFDIQSLNIGYNDLKNTIIIARENFKKEKCKH